MEVSARFVAGFTVMVVLVSMAFGTLLGMTIEEEDCPDCNAVCPDVIDYGEDYRYILENMSWKLNLTKEQLNDLILFQIGNFQHLQDMLEEMERNISYDLGWLEYDVDWMKYMLRNIRNDTIDLNVPQYPRDYITIVNYTENTSLQIEYYDNLYGQNFTSPTFTIQNWTELMDWSYSIGDARLYPNQRMMILLIGINMAYYKETGTWLGE